MALVLGVRNDFAAASGSASAPRRARRPSSVMNPVSFDRFASAPRMAGMTAPRPVDSAASESPVAADARASVAGVMRSLMLSSMDAMVLSLSFPQAPSVLLLQGSLSARMPPPQGGRPGDVTTPARSRHVESGFDPP